MSTWKSRAACAGLDAEVFYRPIVDGQYHLTDFTWDPEPAKQVCAGCPVRQPCLDEALANNETAGVWGGLDETERRKLTGRDYRGHIRVARRCRICDTPFVGTTTVFCSDDCRQTARSETQRASRLRNQRAS